MRKSANLILLCAERATVAVTQLPRVVAHRPSLILSSTASLTHSDIYLTA